MAAGDILRSAEQRYHTCFLQNWEKYILKFGQIYLKILTSLSCNVDKFMYMEGASLKRLLAIYGAQRGNDIIQLAL